MKKGFVDLHAHTTASDGSMSPKELVRHAKDLGLVAVAVTDHDTIDGIKEAVEEGEKQGIEVIAGLEISADFDPEMHMLGYFFDDSYLNLRVTLDRLKENRNERNPKIIRKLNELGFNVTMEEVVAKTKGDVIGRPHIAKVMVEKGYVTSVAEAFAKYLSSGRPAYFKKDKLTPVEGIREITEAGGIPVLAHPIHLGMDRSELDILLSELAHSGLKGMEVYYVDNNDSETAYLAELAQKHNLIATGGSDFHGIFKPDIELGKGRGNLEIPYDAVEKLKALLK